MNYEKLERILEIVAQMDEKTLDELEKWLDERYGEKDM